MRQALQLQTGPLVFQESLEITSDTSSSGLPPISKPKRLENGPRTSKITLFGGKFIKKLTSYTSSFLLSPSCLPTPPV